MIQHISYKSAKQILTLINNAGPVLQSAELKTQYICPPEQISMPDDIVITPFALQDPYSARQAQSPLGTWKDPDLIPGYTTKDDAGDDGDDTVHAPITFYKVPNCIQSELGLSETEYPDTVDVVFIDFIKPWVLLALQYTGESFTNSDVRSYRPETLTDLMAVWIKEHWGQDC